MMRKILFYVSVFFYFFVFSQENQQTIPHEEIEVAEDAQELVTKEEVTYYKTTEYNKQRTFKNDLKSKYSGREFTYKDNVKKKPKKKKETPPQKLNKGMLAFFSAIVSFMSTAFPYLLALLVIFILVRSFLNTEGGVFKFGKVKKKVAEKLIYEEDENIENNDYTKLLNMAINDKNYRLATRYYYLSVLQKLSQKNLIDYHKDKTNSEYLFELQSKENRKHFSHLSYIYDYVWYGEFPVDNDKFSIIENNYQSFIKTL